ncbi:solute carrier family 23 member 1-like [Pecten maximus]|uniref:solute carrier family 23 member 1-like n=1 Tax=Pecten maximus TaxID=6579 RepID=UPI0014589FA6|nr:solute carrier family 23 member 1-like [Pecten maximus]
MNGISRYSGNQSGGEMDLMERIPLKMEDVRLKPDPTFNDVTDTTENFRNSYPDVSAVEVGPPVRDKGESTDESSPRTQSSDSLVNPTSSLVYKISDNPPIHLTIVFAFQQALLAFAVQLVISLLVAQAVNGEHDPELRGSLLSSTMFMCGFTTMIMSLFGTRLPIFQGGAAEYIIPLLVLQDDVQKQKGNAITGTTSTNTTSNYTGSPLFYSNDTAYQMNITNMAGTDILLDHQGVDFQKLRGMMGSLMVIGCIHSMIGLTGLVGILLRFIGPITVVPTLLLLGLWMARMTAKFISIQWGVGIMTAAISIILSLVLGNWKMPLPFWSKTKGFHLIRSNFHQTAGSRNLVASPTIPKEPEYFARTDIMPGIIQNASWIYFPYPGQFGLPLIRGDALIGFLIATMVSILDSIADYYACAIACNVPPPPAHAVNRGIAVEGFCSFLSGTLGCGHATGSYGGNIGAIRITKVASRRVFVVLGCIYMLFGIIGKLCAVFITIPYPVLGGITLIMISMFMGVVIANLHHVDLRSNRNLAIMGMAFTVGTIVPYWIEQSRDRLKTGSETLDKIFIMVFGNATIAGTLLACVLDNTIAGTPTERGLTAWTEVTCGKSDDRSDVIMKDEIEYSEGLDVYDPIVPGCVRRWKGLRYVSIMPDTFTYKQNELDIKENA